MKPIQIIARIIIVAIMIALFFSSCMTADKATGYLSAHRETAASYCAAQFPVKTDSVVITVHDTIMEHAQERDLTDFADSVILTAYQKKEAEKKDLEDYIDVLEKDGTFRANMIADLRAKAANIKSVDTAALKRSTDEKILATIKACTETTTRITQENTAKSEAATLRAERLQNELNEMTDKRDWWRTVALIEAGLIVIFTLLKIFKSNLGPFGKFIP